MRAIWSICVVGLALLSAPRGPGKADRALLMRRDPFDGGEDSASGADLGR